MNRFMLIGVFITMPFGLFAGSDEASYFGQIAGKRLVSSYSVNDTPEQVAKQCKQSLYGGRFDQYISYSDYFIEACVQGFFTEARTWKR